MKIVCPHCQCHFKNEDALHSMRESESNWAVDLIPRVKCPECGGDCETQLTARGAIFLVCMMILAGLLVEFGGYLHVVPVFVLVLYVLSRHNSFIFSVKNSEGT